MNKPMRSSIVVLSLILLIIIITSVASIFKKTTLDQQYPNDVLNLIENYLEAYKQGTSVSIVFMHFEDDFNRSAYSDSNDYLIDYKIESIERINRNLYEVRLLIMSELTRNYFGDEPQLVYNFVCRIHGKWWYINGIRHIPPNLRSGLDDSIYEYLDPKIVDPEDIIKGYPFKP